MDYARVALVTSASDPASSNMREHLLAEDGWIEKSIFQDKPVFCRKDRPGILLYTTAKHTIYQEGIDEHIVADLFIFLSTHTSRSGIPSFTCHMPGNWASAEMGGSPHELCRAPAAVLKHAFLSLVKAYERSGREGYDVVQEATHHGPFIKEPCLFMEIGSTEKEWVRPENGKFMAGVVLQIAEDVIAQNIPEAIPAVGLGGTHTATNFYDLMKGSPYAVAHICPKYAMADLDERMLRQALERNDAQCNTILVDWKGLGGEKQRIKPLLEKLSGEGITWMKTSQAKGNMEKDV